MMTSTGPVDSNPRSSLRILLAEDDPTARDVALLMLDRLGCHAALAADGLGAVAAVNAGVYDVVLMDLQMPRMDGMEATRRIRSAVAGPGRPTIIAMTADSTVECRQRCQDAGMDHHLAKPVAIGALAGSLDREVRRLATFDHRQLPSVSRPSATVRRSPATEPAPFPAPDGPTLVSGTDPLGPSPVYDPGVLDALIAELGGDGVAVRRDLIESYLLDVADRLPVIAAAGRHSDLEALVFQAHALKSASAMIGLVALSGIAETIESGAETAPDAVDTAGQAALLVVACNRAVESLRRALVPEGGERAYRGVHAPR